MKTPYIANALSSPFFQIFSNAPPSHFFVALFTEVINIFAFQKSLTCKSHISAESPLCEMPKNTGRNCLNEEDTATTQREN